MLEALRIHITGIVQGVGFRPFTYNTAQKYNIAGWVQNATDGVHVYAEGQAEALDKFTLELANNAPLSAQVAELTIQECKPEGMKEFEIRFSNKEQAKECTLVSPDLATCSDCIHELFDPRNRRFRYPFINCTNCGPRFTIIDKLPYDRRNTSMRHFDMCEPCTNEYEDPSNRRFHAQPNACFDCGPSLSLSLACPDKEDILHTDQNACAEQLDCNKQSTQNANSEQTDSNKQSKQDPNAKQISSNKQPIQDTNAEPTKQNANAAQIDSNKQSIQNTNAESSKQNANAEQSSPVAHIIGKEVSAHAAPNAFTKPCWGNTRTETDALFAHVIELLRSGNIVAVKGLGGFHLVCDADNTDAVKKLRARKHRKSKPFAVMMQNVEAIRDICKLSAEEEAQLNSPASPIVLLKKLHGQNPQGQELYSQKLHGQNPHGQNQTTKAIPEGIADGLPELGVMLPNTPVQHILMHDFCQAGGRMLVMTSGNAHGQPIVTSNKDATSKLAGIADAILGNNREILSRYDDSVLRVIPFEGIGEMVQILRRARGFSPIPIAIPTPMPVSAPAQEAQEQLTPVSAPAQEAQQNTAPASTPVQTAQEQPTPAQTTQEQTIFSTGPEQKNTCTILKGNNAYVSQHIGDLEEKSTYTAWLEAKRRLERLFRLTPQCIAFDMHPAYLSSQWAEKQSRPRIEVQHHHAHIVSVMAENNLEDAVCGISFDGTGLGVDNTIWGGEILLSNLKSFERFANFSYVPQPGGSAAIAHPLQMAYGILHNFDLLKHTGAHAALQQLGQKTSTLKKMIENEVNTPYTSSVGRLFDAASALLGICTQPSYQGEAAILLEACIYDSAKTDWTSYRPRPNYSVEITKNVAHKNSTAQDTSIFLLDAKPTFKALLDDIAAQKPPQEIASYFHSAIVEAIVHCFSLMQAMYDINTVALSGGVFMNTFLIKHSIEELCKHGATIALNKNLPPNDGNISLGQAVVAFHSLNNNKK